MKYLLIIAFMLVSLGAYAETEVTASGENQKPPCPKTMNKDRKLALDNIKNIKVDSISKEKEAKVVEAKI